MTSREFLQYLTLFHARDLLREGKGVLETAMITGLSGPGRLHDLCVKLEVATLGELKSGGKGLSISYGFAESPFGRCLLGECPRGICHLAFVESDNGRAELVGFQGLWPHATLQHDDAGACRLAGEVFARPGHAREQRALRAYVRGTAFQVQVWRALLQVRPGTLVSYGQLAAALGRPAAARAVGTAMGRNPLAFFIPCHRVIRETGVFGEYRWGRERKRAMVAWESSLHARESVPGTTASGISELPGRPDLASDQ